MEKEVKKEEVTTEKKSNKGLVITLIVLASLLLVGLIVCLIIMFLNKNTPIENGAKITITFDSDGGLEVDKITFKKGTTVELPTSTKDGFEFGGWLNGEKEFTKEDTPKLEKDVLLKAKWNELTSEESLMTINFDSKGGNKVSSIQVKCINNSTEIKDLPTPKRNGYNFMSWADKNGTPILNGANLICDEELNLYANWEKKDEEKWTCESGDGPDANHKCKLSMTPDMVCPSGTYEINGTCVRLTWGDHKPYEKVCKKEMITYMSYAGMTEGEMFTAGTTFCGYYKTSDTTKSACESHGFTWSNNQNKCYVKLIANNTINSCTSGYAKVENPNSIQGVNGLNEGCYPIVNREKKCSDSSYSLTGEYCTKYVDAKKVN